MFATVIQTERRQDSSTPDLTRDSVISYNGWTYSANLPFGGRFGNFRSLYSDDCRGIPGADLSTLEGALTLVQAKFAERTAWEERTICKYGAYGAWLPGGREQEERSELTQRRVFLHIGDVYGGSNVRIDNLTPETRKHLAAAAYAAMKRA